MKAKTKTRRRSVNPDDWSCQKHKVVAPNTCALCSQIPLWETNEEGEQA